MKTTTDHEVLDQLTIPDADLDAAVVVDLQSRLVRAAEMAGLLDIAYRTVDSPLGPLLLVATPTGVVRVAFDNEDHDRVLEALSEQISPRILRAPERLEGPAHQLDEYFAGTRRSFDVSVDLRLTSGFRRRVLDHLRTIAYGTTESYTEVAAASGSPAAVRAAGSACANNPVPLVVPCHRVVRSDGTIGQYRGGTAAKKILLALEAQRS